MNKILLILLMISSIAVEVSANNYYLSSSTGNDANSGRSPSKAWASIGRLNKAVLKPGDSVLFKCNDVFCGELIIQNSGKESREIVYSTFGSGHAPILTGAIEFKEYEQIENHKFLFSVPQTITGFFINEKEQTLARFPNHGYLTMGEGTEKIGFKSGLLNPDGYWNGATICMRTIDWVFERRQIKSFSKGFLEFSEPSRYNLQPGYGYYLENKAELMDTAGEWYYADKKLWYISDEKLSGKKIEGTLFNNGIVIKPEVKYVVINGLQIEKYNQNGIWVQQSSSNIKVSGNIIRLIGLTGILLDTLINNSVVRDNIIKDVSGRGIFGIRISDCTISSNHISRIGLKPGQGISGVNGMIGIVIQNNEANHNLSNSRNNRIAFNEVDSTGYAGIRMDGENSICEYNIVKNTSLKLNDSGAIYCFGKVKNRTQNNIIRNNLVLNAIGNTDATPGNNLATNGIYIDNNSTGIIVENNSIINVTNSGVLVNDSSPGNTIRGNTIFNCTDGIGFAEWAHKDSLYRCVVETNTIVCTKEGQHPLSLLTFLGPDLKPGSFNNNTYINAPDGFIILKKTVPEKGVRRQDRITLDKWQEISGQDTNSRYVKKKGAMVIYNSSFREKAIPLDKGDYEDLNGNKLEGSVIVAPCTAFIVFRTDIY